MKLNESIKYYRNKLDMTQKQLADKAEISLRALSNYEKGLREPSIEILLKLAKALDVNIKELKPVYKNDLNIVQQYTSSKPKKLYWATNGETYDFDYLEDSKFVDKDLNNNVDILEDILSAINHTPNARTCEESSIGIIRYPKRPNCELGFNGNHCDESILILVKSDNNGTLYVHSTDRAAIEYFLANTICESNF